MSEIERPLEFRAAWRRADPAIERDAAAFWATYDLLPPDSTADERFRELCIVAYDGAKVAAVSTAAIREVAFLGVRLAMFRCAVSPESRRKRLSYAMMTRAREVIEEWSAAHKEEEVMGMATVAQTNEAFLGRGPAIFEGSRLVFVGWTEKGERMRVAWFGHATVPRFPPGGAKG
jgi:hypothetical protein